MKTHSTLYSIIIGLAVLIWGYGGLLVLYMITSVDKGLDGLFHYYAATLGDGLFIPFIFVFGLIIIRTNPDDSKRRLADIISFVGALVGVAWQASWLINARTAINWTIPKAHSFNLAGWYHALFFVGMFSLIPRILFLATASFREQSSKSILFVFMWLAAIGYWHMHLIDDCLSESNYPTWLWLTVLISEIIFIIVVGPKGANNEIILKTHIPFFVGNGLLTVGLFVACKNRVYEKDVHVFIGEIIGYLGERMNYLFG